MFFTHSWKFSRPPWCESEMMLRTPPCRTTDRTMTTKKPASMTPSCGGKPTITGCWSNLICFSPKTVICRGFSERELKMSSLICGSSVLWAVNGNHKTWWLNHKSVYSLRKILLGVIFIYLNDIGPNHCFKTALQSCEQGNKTTAMTETDVNQHKCCF